MSKLPNDDLFESTRMPFGQHLEELRRALFKSMVGIAAGFLIGMPLAGYVVDFIQSPLKRALTKHYLEKAEAQIASEFEGFVPLEYLNLIGSRRVVPETIEVDAGSLAAALRRVDPDFAIAFKPHGFTDEDALNGDFSALCKAIESDAQTAGSPGEAVWQLLPSRQRELLERVAEQEHEQDRVEPTDRREVIAALNDVIDQAKLREATAFKQLVSEAEAAVGAWSPIAAVDKDWAVTVVRVRDSLEIRHDDDQSRRLNKLLLAHAFSDMLRPPQTMTVNLRIWKPAEVWLQALSPEEAFMIWLKAAAVTGLVIASPWVFWQIWHFAAAGLYPHEKRYVHIYLPLSVLLFLAGVGLAFFFVFGPVLDFLFSFNRRMHIDAMPRISEWMSFVLLMPLGFGVAFQLPLVMLFLNRIGVFSVRAYLDKWRIAILAIFVISMLLTPAEPVSMLLMAGPLTVLYFGGVALSRWMPRGRSPFAE